ncbi:MAG TPA: MFS transporter [Actinomycetota bacterium]|nr:MFS transporter [Actinomycetota bacterium]
MQPPEDSADQHSYRRLLMVLLGTATFFEGYDSGITAIVLRDLAREFDINTLDTTRLTGPIVVMGFGAFGAMFVTMLGDRIGRRPLMIITTFAYALFTGLTATSQSLGAFMTYQFFARAFLIAEFATAITIVAEEFPADRRGRALGTLTALGAFGLPLAAVVHLMSAGTSLGWRTVYIVGLIPLMVVGVLRTKLRETARWQAARASGDHLKRVRFRTVLDGEHRRTLLTVSALYFFAHFALLGASTWWPLFVRAHRGFSASAVTALLLSAFPLGVAGFLAAGRLQDRIGRRPTGTIFLVLGLAFGLATFQVRSLALMFPVLAMAVFFGFGVSPVLGAIVTESFPTDIRATSVAFARSIFGTLGATLGPFTVGILADRQLAARVPGWPVLGNLGACVSVAILMYIPAMFILRRLPETAGAELEAIAN